MIGDKKDHAAVHHCAQFVEKNDKCSLWELFSEGMKFQASNWQTTKPEFTEDCLLITATYLKLPLTEYWNYSFFEIKWVDMILDNGATGYWGIFCEDGDEWGDIGDLKADRYLVLPLIK